MWPEILELAKEGGINLVQTYVFWNIHEPIQGQVKFSKLRHFMILSFLIPLRIIFEFFAVQF